MLSKLRDAGMNVVRMNFSHGDYSYHGSVIANAREAEKSNKERPLAIALDTKGPEIRTGILKNDKDVLLEQGNPVTVTTNDARKSDGDASTVYVDYKNITQGFIIFSSHCEVTIC